jgi:3-dehydroquinate synthase
VQTLQVDVGHSRYPIIIGGGLLRDRDLVAAQLPGRDLMIVTNTTVARLYLETLRSTLGERGIAECILPDGEQHKTLQTAGWVFDAMVGSKLNRDATVLALGGGVVGDIAGFVAACYQRGIGYVQIPTTLLAQVDSSVGGKTGVNHSGGKNLIGAFYQPLAVLADTDTLATLPDRELAAGLAEVIKYGCLGPAAVRLAGPAYRRAQGPGYRGPDIRDRAVLRHQGDRRGARRTRTEPPRDLEFRPYLRSCHRSGHGL